MNILHQFMESSIAVTEQIALIMQENTQLKQRIAELEAAGQLEPDPEPNICDLMPIGETFCGWEVVLHDEEDSLPICIKAEGRGEWIFKSTAKAIYEAEMELRELRKTAK
jgi:hypothetical protein